MSPCESCHAGCCRAFAVPVTGADILRIETARNLAFRDFVCRWADPEGKIGRNHAPHFRFSDQPSTPFVICLKHEASRYFTGTTKCRFLVESPPDERDPLGRAQCGIYEHRPGTCRTFPAKLSTTSDFAVITEVPQRGRESDHAVYQLCPRQWEPSDFHAIELMQDLVVAKYEMAYFKQLAAIWNRAPRPFSIFPDYLHLVYSRRVVRESPNEKNVSAAGSAETHTGPPPRPTQAA